LLLKIFRDFAYKCKIVPVYKEWRNQSQHFKKQKRSLLSLVLRKEAKNKIYVMNEFRKCVQYYEKKEMHQVLTDLNKKMEAINEKSTQFRDLLKNCIENLGVIASKKIDYVTNYALNYQQRDFFHTYISQKIKKTYKALLLARLLNICQISCERQTFSALHEHTKMNKREK
jgi:predicted GNAT family acetyltransferase